jgi:RNA polymerase sigma-70 factor (ECF subfamily)
MLDSHFGSPLPTLPRRVPPVTPHSSHSWESAFRAYYVELCEYVLRFVGSAEAAQDLVQDLFLRLWDSRGPRDATRLTRPYLYVAARNRALKYLRHRRVVTAWIARAACEETPLSDTPEDLCLRGELDDAVQQAIAALPARCRAIFVLRRREQLSYREIATRLGVSLGTVKSQMWRATLRLRAKLAPYLARPVIPEDRAG